MEGWIKLHRKLLENPICGKPEWAWVWIVILLKANHQTNKFLFNGQDIEIEKGSFITGRKQLAKETNVSEQTIRSVLKYLETNHQITKKVTNKFTIISVCKYEEYQNIEKELTNQQPTTNQPVTTNKNDNNVKNINNINLPVKIEDNFEEMLKPSFKIAQEWQYLALEIIEKLNVPDNKKSSFFKACKENPNLCNISLQYAIDFPNPKIRWNMFFVKYNQLKNGDNKNPKT